MAYGLKYTYTFKQVKTYTTDDWKLNIYLEGYGGASSEISFIQRNSIQLTRDGDVLDQVLGTRLTFGLMAQSINEWSEFRDADWGDYKVELIKDPTGTPVTKFVGYNQTDIFTEPYDETMGGGATLEFTCGLSHLKYIRFDNSGTLYDGQKSIIEVIRLCLNKLPTALNIREHVNLYEDSINSTTTDSMLAQIFVDSTVYKEKADDDDQDNEVGMFCYDVITEILKPFNAHIYIAEGTWYIFRPQDYQESTIYYRQFLPRVGSESTVTVDSSGSYASNKRTETTVDNGNANELIIVAPQTELSIEPPLNRAKVTYEQKHLDIEDSNIIKNGCFLDRTTTQSGNNYYDSPAFWTFNGDDPTTYQAFYSLNIGGDEFFQFEPTSQKTQTSWDLTKYMTQGKDDLPTATTDSLQLRFDAIFRGKADLNAGGNINNSPSQFFYSDLKFTWEMIIQFGTYYLSGDPDAGYSWVASTSRAKFWKKGFENKGVTRSIYRFFDVFTIEQTLPTLPENGLRDFDITIYKPYSNWDSYANSNTDYTFVFENLGQRCFKLVYLPNENPPPKEQILYSKINEDENVEEITVLHGDGLATNTMTSFRLSDGTITDSWDRRGKTDNLGILNLLLRQLRDLLGDYTRILNGQVIGEFEPYNTIEELNSPQAEYWIKGYTYAVETNEWDCELFELADNSAVSTTFTEDLEVTNIGVDIDTGTATNVNNDPNSTQMVSSETTVASSEQTDITEYP